MNEGLLRTLLGLAFGLALVVVAASSGLRLAANGLGCEPWPRCYGSPAPAVAAQQHAGPQAVRLTHRLAASAFVIAVLGAVLFGWRAWNRPARAVAVFLVVVTTLLAVLGRYTPSAVPAVTLANVIGGMSLVGGTAFLLAARPPGTPLARPWRWWLLALLLLAALQAAGGAMISARSAGSACEHGCGAQPLPGTLRLWNPLRAGSATEVLHSVHAGEVLHQVHRLLAIVVTVLGVVIAATAPVRTRDARLMLAALAGCAVAGIALTSLAGPLGVAVAHALGAGVLIAGIAVLLSGRSAGREIA